MRVAIVGAGISGLAAAYLLEKAGHDVTVFEAGSYIGGHTNTVAAEVEGAVLPVDTGFIVHNDRTYPHFIRLLHELGVATQPTEMSFSVQCERTGLEYNGHTLSTLFAQRRNLWNPAFLGMLRDILRFNRDAKEYLNGDASEPVTLGQFLEARCYGPLMKEAYILPMGAAIWSSPAHLIEEFPARAFFRFFENHGLLSVNDRPEWRVVVGGSWAYVRALTRRLRRAVRTHSPVGSIRRGEGEVTISTGRWGEERYDHAVLACHADQALELLGDASKPEREILGAIPYFENEAVLHTDARMLPKSRLAWASWNCFLPSASGQAPAVTYNQSILQNFATRNPVCVTLNRTQAIDPRKILRRIVYHHPQYTAATFGAQSRWKEISGVRRTHFCGAYWGWGFHEDGVVSALRVARSLGAAW